MRKLNNIDQEVIKEANTKRIINLLYKKKELTKSEIAKDLKISIPTVISNINDLIIRGIVEECGVACSTGGRKPIIVRFLPDSMYSFGVEITKQYSKIILVNLESKVKQRDILYIYKNKSFEEILNDIELLVFKLIKKENISQNKILGLGISLPGTVDEEKLLLKTAPNLGVKDMDFNNFSLKFPFPIYIENEANAAARAELILGIAKEMKNLLYLSIGYGVGAGIVLQDNLYKGKNKRAGELGHMTIVPEGRLCNCGRKGCWELYTSEISLLNRYNEKTRKEVKTLSEFFEYVEMKDIDATQCLDEYIYYLSIGIQNIILILDPHYVVIGGSICKYLENKMDMIHRTVFVENSLYEKEDTKILISKLKEDASIHGAALLPFQKLFYLEDKVI